MKRLIAIGGGSLKEKTTLKIDEYIATLAKEHSGEKRAYGLFIGTASHDFMPYFNSFRKVYTSVFDIKADCLLTVFTESTDEKIDEKFAKADFIYIGGGDTLFMLDKWKERGILNKIKSAYERGVIIVGASAGAVCWFNQMFTDSQSHNNGEDKYYLYNGLGLIDGTVCPHYNLRLEDFDKAVIDNNIQNAYALEDDSAIEFKDGEISKVLSSGGKAYKISLEKGEIIKKTL